MHFFSLSVLAMFITILFNVFRYVSLRLRKPALAQSTAVAEFTVYFFAEGVRPPMNVLWPSQLGLQNIPTASLHRSKTPSTNVLAITLNNLDMKLNNLARLQ